MCPDSAEAQVSQDQVMGANMGLQVMWNVPDGAEAQVSQDPVMGANKRLQVTWNASRQWRGPGVSGPSLGR